MAVIASAAWADWLARPVHEPWRYRQAGVAAQYPLMHVGQRGSRFSTQFVDQAATGLTVEAERVARPAASVQRGHLADDQSFVQRMTGQHGADLAEKIGVAAQVKLTFHPLDTGRAALFLKAVAHPRSPLAAHPRQRVTPPQRIGLIEQHDSLSRSPASARALASRRSRRNRCRSTISGSISST
jgi:hypothetical protein